MNRIKNVELGFVPTYQEANVLELRVDCDNFSFISTAHFNIWNGETNYKLGGKPIKRYKDLDYTDGSIIDLEEQMLEVTKTLSDLLIQANKKNLEELVGMLIIPLNKNGLPATIGQKVVDVEIPQQQIININGKERYELTSVVEEMKKLLSE